MQPGEGTQGKIVISVGGSLESIGPLKPEKPVPVIIHIPAYRVEALRQMLGKGVSITGMLELEEAAGEQLDVEQLVAEEEAAAAEAGVPDDVPAEPAGDGNAPEAGIWDEVI